MSTGFNNLALGVASSILISIGSITTINTINYPVIGIALIICGSIGLGIREYLKPKTIPPASA